MKLNKFFPTLFAPPVIPDSPAKKKRRTKKEMIEQKAMFDIPSKIEKERRDEPKHWNLAVTTVVTPRPMNVPDDPAVTRLSFTGKTTYLFVCEETGEFRKEEVEGIEPTDLDVLIAKVDASGPEYVIRQSGTYILMKKPQDTLPVR